MMLEWSPQARSDLLELYRYVATDNLTAARALHSKLFSSIEHLLLAPQMGRVGRISGTRELVIAGTPYIIPYRILPDKVQILRVYHRARKWPESL